MKRIFAAMVAVVLAAGLTPASAAGMHGGGGTHAGGMHAGGVSGIRGLRAAPTLQEPNLQSRIPAPLPPPAQPPVINGPLNPNGMPSMGNGL
jgi:hypothetical protein